MVSLDTGLSVSRLGSEGALEEAVEPDTDFQVFRIDLRTLVFSDEGVVGDDDRVGVRGIVVAGIGGNPFCGGEGSPS